MNCKHSGCFACKEAQARALQKAKWKSLREMTFLEAFLVGVSYVIMIGMNIVFDLVAAFISYRSTGVLPRPSWVVISMILLLVVLGSATRHTSDDGELCHV